jgi:hypothetical protein
MSNTVKNQHYVPQFYLRGFANKNEKLFVYDKCLGRSFANNVKNVAHESYFYDIPEEWIQKDADIQAFEKEFSRIEGIHKKVLDAVLNHHGRGPLGFETAWGLAHMLRMQQARTRSARNLAHEMQTKFTQDLVNDLVERNYGEEGRAYTPKVTIDERATAILVCQKILDNNSVHEFISTLMARFWTIWLNRTSTLFITSDHPVSFAATSYAAENFGVAPCVPFGVEVAFPLSPRCLLTVGDPPRIQRPDCSTLFADEARIALFNKMQVYSSHRHLFGLEDDFGFAHKLCNENPALREQDQDRVKFASFREPLKTTTMTFVSPRYLKLD